MPKSSKTRVTINVDQKPRRILTIEKRSKGDVYLGLKMAMVYRQPSIARGQAGNPRYNDVSFADLRYSIHPSDNSRDGFATIKGHRRLASGTYDTHVLYARGPKSRDLMTLVYSRRHPALGNYNKNGLRFPNTSEDHFLAPDDGVRNISLGSYAPAKCCLYVACFVGGGQSTMPQGSASDLSAVTVEAGQFNIHLIWSFLPIFSTDHGTYTSALTPPGLSPYQQIVDVTPATAIMQFKMARKHALEEYLFILRRDYGCDAAFEERVLRAPRYSASGQTGDFSPPVSPALLAVEATALDQLKGPRPAYMLTVPPIEDQISAPVRSFGKGRSFSNEKFARPGRNRSGR